MIKHQIFYSIETNFLKIFLSTFNDVKNTGLRQIIKALILIQFRKIDGKK